MPWREAAQPVRMTRIALVVPGESLRDALVRVAGSGVVELERLGAGETPPGEAGRRLQRAPQPPRRARLSITAPDLDTLERDGRYDLLAGEAQVEEYTASAVRRGGVAALAGWTPIDELPGLAAGLAEVGAAPVPMSRPPGSEAPTLLAGGGLRRTLQPLVQTYGTVPYADIDPTPLAWAAYVLMFGMMFGDVGHGLALLAVAALLRMGRPRRLARFRGAWPFVAGAGVTSTVFGLLYGEFFGPSGVVPMLWLDPLAAPITLLLAAVGLGAFLLAGAYAIGIVNRLREGGWSVALYASSGVAGSSVFLGLALAAAGWYAHHAVLGAVGGFVALAGLALAFTGFLAETDGGGAGVLQAGVELFDLVIRLGSNVVSFARLAAFGLTHAAIGWMVWSGTAALWQRGGIYLAGAVLVFVVGNALAFSLEALVAAIQALRLEYYELFSRIFTAQGRPFRPWHLPLVETGSEGKEGD